MTVWDMLEIGLLLLLGIYSLFEGLFLKRRRKEHLFLLKLEDHYGRWIVRAFYILLGLLLLAGGVRCHTEFCVTVNSRKASKLGLVWF